MNRGTRIEGWIGDEASYFLVGWVWACLHGNQNIWICVLGKNDILALLMNSDCQYKIPLPKSIGKSASPRLKSLHQPLRY